MEPGSGIDTFIQDIHYILKEINESQNIKRAEIKDHFKNIASNPEHSYSAKEQVAILLEIMKCYNTNIVEYQKNMRELGIITKNLIKSHNNRSFSEESHTSDETIKSGSSSSLYDYFIQLIWGKPNRKKAVEPGREPSVDLANIFMNLDNEIIEHTITQTSNDILGESSNKSRGRNNVIDKNPINPDILIKKRRNTIQPIVKHIPHM
jgi:chromosome condensin MukBEF ATPase and DNA-binding subunit MukB